MPTTPIQTIKFSQMTDGGNLGNGDHVPGLLAGANVLFDVSAPTGSWTPVVAFGGASTGITYTTQLGEYKQLANLVFVTALIQLSNVGSATGALTISGLPIAQGGTPAASNMLNMTLQNASIHNNSVLGNVNAGGVGASGLQVVYMQNSGAFASYTNSDITNTTQILINGFYFSS